MAYEKQESAGIWIPQKVGDELEGEVTSIDQGDYGKQYTVKKENGDEVKTPSHKVLQSRAVKIVVSDKVKFVYLGEEPPSIKGYSPTRMYDVLIDK